MNPPKPRDRWLGTTLSAFLLLLVPGCALFGHAGAQRIGEIHLFGLPTALTAPGSSLPGGVGVRIYASQVGGSQGLPIVKGRLEVLMFNQSATGLNAQTQKPFKVWSLEPTELAAFRVATKIGTCYQLELTWNQDDRPKGKVLTVVARYQSSDNSEIYSNPTTIALTSH